MSFSFNLVLFVVCFNGFHVVFYSENMILLIVSALLYLLVFWDETAVFGA